MLSCTSVHPFAAHFTPEREGHSRRRMAGGAGEYAKGSGNDATGAGQGGGEDGSDSDSSDSMMCIKCTIVAST